MIYEQIFHMVNVGIVILDLKLKVVKWNRWMEIHSDVSCDTLVGKSIFDFYPNLDIKWFNRSCKSVFAFGNTFFITYKLYKTIFPFKPISSFVTLFDNMCQDCIIGPLRKEDKSIEYLYIMVSDVTKIASYERKLLDMGAKDGLTNIYNRKYFETKLEEEIERCNRYKKRFSLIILDIDFFKKVNDKYGHLAGDYILKAFTKIIAKIIRTSDIFARYGGEEFCCILPETVGETALIISERIRGGIEETVFEYKKDIKIKITVSQGVAVFDNNNITKTELINLADKALYKAKKQGRNQVVIA